MSSILTERGTGSEPSRTEVTAYDRLVTTARKLLKRSARAGLNRRELAREAGISPALVRYYTRDYHTFVVTVAEKAVTDYAAKINWILAGNTGRDAKLRAVILLFLRAYREDGSLIEPYFANTDALTHGAPLQPMASALTGLRAFFTDCANAGSLRQKDAAFVQSILWSACRAAVLESEALRHQDVDMASVEERQADLILALLLREASTPASVPAGQGQSLPFDIKT